MHTNSFEVIILKRQPIFEVDALFTAVSKERGKVFFKAVGVNKSKSKLSGKLQVPSRLQVRLTGKELPIVTEVEEMDVFPHIRLDHTLMPFTHFALEIVLRTSMEQDPNDDLYSLLYNFLARLNDREDPLLLTEQFLSHVNKSLGVHSTSGALQELVSNLEAFLDRNIKSKGFV